AYRAQVKRLVMPWAPTPVGYEVVTRRGDFAVARGQSVTLAGYVQSTGAADELPKSATLVITDANGKTTRLGMKSEQAHVFHQKINTVADSFRYRIESGDAVGSEHDVIAVDPVQLVADSPTITIIPPAYAQRAVETKKITGLGDFSALQFSKVIHEFRFTRPAVGTRVVWTPKDGLAFECGFAASLWVRLSEDGRSGRMERTLVASRHMTLSLEAEHS